MSQLMNPMNPMYLIRTDWQQYFIFNRNKSLEAKNKYFFVFQISKRGSLMFIWFIGALHALLTFFFNEPNVYECRKGTSMRHFSRPVLECQNGRKTPENSPVFEPSNVLDSGPMYIKFINCDKDSLNTE